MQLLQAGHLAQPLRATYARLLVDEYQDCNVVQHAIVSGWGHAEITGKFTHIHPN